MLSSSIRRVGLRGCNQQSRTTTSKSGTRHTQGTVWTADPYLPPVVYHPRPHGIPAAILHFRSHYKDLLDLFTYFAVHAASALAIPTSRPIFLPTQRTLWTVPRGPFAHKKSQENFDRKVHKRAIKAWDAHPEVIGAWVSYLEAYHVAGVGLRTIRWERAPVGFGKMRLAGVTQQLDEIKRLTDRGQVAALGEAIVKAETQATAGDQEPRK